AASPCIASCSDRRFVVCFSAMATAPSAPILRRRISRRALPAPIQRGVEATLAPAAPASPEALPLPRVVHLTTSYPRHAEDFAGRFVADVVEGLERRGLDVSVLAPGGYRDFGLAYGGGLVHNLKRRPWLAPLLLVSMIRAV